MAERREYFGRNEHKVPIPSYPVYLFDTMTVPFFLLQYFVTAVFIAEGVILFAITMLVFSFATTTINYVILYRTFLAIKETAEKSIPVTIFRNG